MFEKEAVELFFNPYQVGCYATGPQFVTIKYKEIVTLMRDEYIDALQIRHLLWDKNLLTNSTNLGEEQSGIQS